MSLGLLDVSTQAIKAIQVGGLAYISRRMHWALWAACNSRRMRKMFLSLLDVSDLFLSVLDVRAYRRSKPTRWGTGIGFKRMH